MYPLAVPIGDSIFVGPKPRITSLANLWDIYGRFVAAIVDRQGARLLIFVQLGEIVDGEGVLGEEVRRIKSGVNAVSTGQISTTPKPRPIGKKPEIKRNVKESAAALAAFCEKHAPRYVVLGGNAEVLNELRGYLPQPWAERVIGMFAADISNTDLGGTRSRVEDHG